MPAQLFELPFIDGLAIDIETLRNRRPQMAQALSKGILAFLGIQAQPQEPAPIPCLPPVAEQPGARTVRFNLLGREICLNGYIENGITMVAARQAFEEAGFDVSWDGANSTVIVEDRADNAEFVEIMRELVH